MPQPGSLGVESSIGKLNRYKLPGIGQIPAELILAGWYMLRCEIHKFINFIWNKGEVPLPWK